MPQHFVSWIQAIGLIVGLYGFFFLSLDILGDDGEGPRSRWFLRFRALLPATAVALGMLILISLSGTLVSLPNLILMGAGLVSCVLTFRAAARDEAPPASEVSPVERAGFIAHLVYFGTGIVILFEIPVPSYDTSHVNLVRGVLPPLPILLTNLSYVRYVLYFEGG